MGAFKGSEGDVNLDALRAHLARLTITEAYDSFGFDYLLSDTVGRDVEDRARDGFLGALEWRARPTQEFVRRLFNQVNMFYAERWVDEQPNESPSHTLLECNRLTLFRQGKPIGWRMKPVEFGARNYLDFMDPFRRSKWLRGVHPEFIPTVIDDWCSAVSTCPRTRDNAIALAMSLIAIHPFSDANGRIGRLVVPWLCKRWGQELQWLDEGSDGELLRTGYGVESTEYLMAAVVIGMAGGHNVIPPGMDGRQPELGAQAMSEALRGTLRHLAESEVTQSLELKNLIAHLQSNGHIRRTSPRFESLQSVLY